MQPHRRLGLILVLTAITGWSTAGLFTRLLALDAPTILFWRGLFGAIGTLALLPVLPGSSLQDLRKLGRTGTVYAVVTAASMLLYISALLITSVAHVAVITALVPLFAALLGWWALRERLSQTALIASMLALIGVALMVGVGRDGRLLGDAMALGMAILMAAMILFARKAPHLPALAVMALASALSAIATLPFATVTGLTAAQIALLAFFALMTQVIGFGLFALGARHLAPTETAMLTTLEVPLALFWIWLFFGLVPAPATLLGGTIVIGAVLFYLLRADHRPPPQSPA